MNFSWQTIWRLIKRWWWLAALGVALAGGTSYYFASRKPNIYAGRTRLMVGSSIRSPDPNSRDFGLSVTLAQIYGEMARLRPITQGVVDRLQLPIGWQDLAWRVETRVIPNAQLLEIIVYDTNPDFAATLANAVADELIRQSPAMSDEGVDREFIIQELADTQQKMEDVQKQIDELRDSMLQLASAVELEDARTQLNELEQLKSSYRSVYLELAGVLNTQSPNTLTVVEPASPSWDRVAPNPKKDTMIAAIAGLALAIATVVALEFLDDTLYVHDDGAESVMGLPVLGTVPRMQGGRCEPRSPAGEMVRQLRTKVLLSAPSGRLKSLVITSPMPKDGKTVIAANLGVAMAGGGAQIVLVDADLRAPALHEWFDQPNIAGLTELLNADKTQWQQLLPQLLRDTDVPGLLLLSAGRPPLDPSILLASPNMLALLELLSKQFDFVLFDSPPVLTAPDATILSMLVQGTLVVISPGKASRKATRQARDKLRSREDIQVVGIALNRTSLGRYAYSYAYHKEAEMRRGYRARLLHTLTHAVSSLLDIGRPMDPDLLSLSQAAMMLGVRRNTVKRWCQEGRIPAVKRRLRWWVRQSELQSELLDRLALTASGDLGTTDLLELLEVTPELQTTGGIQGETEDGSNGRTISESPQQSVADSADEASYTESVTSALGETGKTT